MNYKEKAIKYIDSVGIQGMKLKELEDTKEFYAFTYYHPTEIYAGQGPIFINKLDGDIFTYGSGSGMEFAKQDFLNQIKLQNIIRNKFSDFYIQKTYVMTISRVFGKTVLVDLLLDLNLSYIIPEIVGEDIFRISKKYDRSLLEERLKELPCIFSNIVGPEIGAIMKRNKFNQLLEFQIVEYIETNKETRSERATKEDLKPIW